MLQTHAVLDLVLEEVREFRVRFLTASNMRDIRRVYPVFQYVSRVFAECFLVEYYPIVIQV